MSEAESAPADAVSRAEWRRVLVWALLVMAVTSLPYLVVWFVTPLGTVFPGVLYNADDHAVYLSWMRQAADGKLLFRNLFTSDPQRGIYPHAGFLLLGWLSRLPGLDLPLAYHIGRIAGGTAVLLLVYWLAALFSPDRLARAGAFWTAALSAGLGWLFWRQQPAPGQGPVDVWQPEAITFHSLYSNGLFSISLALMLGVVVCLLLAERHGTRWAVGAGVCGLVLGNVHTYDVIHLAAAWGAYLAARTAIDGLQPRLWGQALLAGLIALPSVALMAWFYATEPIFRARADTATPSFELRWYLLGYGLLIPLALAGAVRLWRSARERSGRAMTLLLPAWAVAGIAVAYLPVAFNRKLIMGTHLPLAVLAGFAAAALVTQVADRFRAPRLRPWLLAVGVAVLSITSVLFLTRDAELALRKNLTSTSVHPAFWPEAEFRVYHWIEANTPPDAVVLRFPPAAPFLPMASGRTVYAGHWGETPRFVERVRETQDFLAGVGGSPAREALLRRGRVSHVILGEPERELERRGRLRTGARPLESEPFLRLVHRDGDIVVLEFVPAPFRGTVGPGNAP